ncbi:hypothetical protein NUU61_001223 [Penicillium alfredii]|uniref:HD/PDEase domain-containing protein n=1 Tax=Penicillium alfredii TaxID=1506179 RepID=A0A9W9GB32_9EURO|nr:uncharacterized protein NUU61_001223 [Penicillium alfredii]KAJ5115464.1 hypothetical protein NUU61_001223 [Penicillium alfredii]
MTSAFAAEKMDCGESLFAAMSAFVSSCMSGHDPSHNPAHVHRVVAGANTILAAEQALDPAAHFDSTVVQLAALLHDIGDRKYISQVAQSTSDTSENKKASLDPTTMVREALLAHGASPDLSAKVQTIVSHVSYTTECKDPTAIQRLIEQGYPELAIVQDADRLDAIGALGIGRCFTFLGAQGRRFVPEGQWEMDNAIEHFGEKLEKLEGMMKTETGRQMARVRTERLRIFRGWWEEEMGMSAGST